MPICKQCDSEFKPNKMKKQSFCSYECYKASLEKPKKFCKNCNNELLKSGQKTFAVVHVVPLLTTKKETTDIDDQS